jgi:hypothetical protein
LYTRESELTAVRIMINKTMTFWERSLEIISIQNRNC